MAITLPEKPYRQLPEEERKFVDICLEAFFDWVLKTGHPEGMAILRSAPEGEHRKELIRLIDSGEIGLAYRDGILTFVAHVDGEYRPFGPRIIDLKLPARN